MGWPEVAVKWPEITKLRLKIGAAAVGFAGQIPARPAAVGREIYGRHRPAVPHLVVRRRLALKFYGRHLPAVAHLVVPHVYINSGRWCVVWSDSSRRAGGYSAQKVFPVWRVFS